MLLGDHHDSWQREEGILAEHWNRIFHSCRARLVSTTHSFQLSTDIRDENVAAAMSNFLYLYLAMSSSVVKNIESYTEYYEYYTEYQVRC